MRLHFEVSGNAAEQAIALELSRGGPEFAPVSSGAGTLSPAGNESLFVTAHNRTVYHVILIDGYFRPSQGKLHASDQWCQESRKRG